MIPMPAQCHYHHVLYAGKLRKLRRRVRHPGAGRHALVAEATHIAKQCPGCPDPPRRAP